MVKTVLNDYVLVKPDPVLQKTKSGLFLPSKLGAPAQRTGTVVSVGAGCKHGLKKGNRVCFKIYSGNTLSIDGEDHLLFEESKILATLG
jgi:co-chaperonin GroES (HSP10)